MPKQTYYNLNPKRREEIDRACIEEFGAKPFHLASVGEISKTVGLSRAAFYKYFKSVEECYYYYLDQANFDVHSCFAKSIQLYNGKLIPALENLNKELGRALFESKNIEVLKNFFVHRNSLLEDGWIEYKMFNREEDIEAVYKNIKLSDTLINSKNMLVSFMKSVTAISHGVIKECFEEDWDRARFEAEYKIRIDFIINGIRK